MESRLSQRRSCGGEEFGTGLVKEGRIEIRENERQGACPMAEIA